MFRWVCRVRVWKRKTIEVNDEVRKFSMVKVFPVLWLDVGTWFNLHNTHQKSNCQTLFLYSEKQNNRKTITGPIFRRGQNFCLIPVSSEISDLYEISDLLLFLSYFTSQNKEIKICNYFFGVCCVNQNVLVWCHVRTTRFSTGITSTIENFRT